MRVRTTIPALALSSAFLLAAPPLASAVPQLPPSNRMVAQVGTVSAPPQQEPTSPPGDAALTGPPSESPPAPEPTEPAVDPSATPSASGQPVATPSGGAPTPIDLPAVAREPAPTPAVPSPSAEPPSPGESEPAAEPPPPSPVEPAAPPALLAPPPPQQPGGAAVGAGAFPAPASLPGIPSPSSRAARVSPPATPTLLPQAESIVTEAQISAGPPLRYLAAGILSIVAAVLALAIAVVSQPRRRRRTH
ncbi:hypothetical protein [Arthrobacter sp. B1805]|uniref:hypothetical protein n=1 Tax=Arthrobacter sp. B1805 TaxID=2058892 RepID=UPI0011B0155A|nr:hypothetical protein [Arthrobacter sp. B1805]